MKPAASALVAIELIMNAAYLVSPEPANYRVSALVSIIVAIVLMIPILGDSRQPS